MLNTRGGELLNANDVINSNDLRKRIINVDSKFRSDLSTPSTDFNFKFTQPYKNLIRLRVASVEIPNVFYTFTKWNNSFIVRVNDINGTLRIVTITIEPGNYSSIDIINAIQTQLNTSLRDPFGIFITVSVNGNTAKVTFTLNGVSAFPVTGLQPAPTQSGKQFIIEFANFTKYKSKPTGFGLGYNLGFRCPIYKVTETQQVGTPPITEYKLTSEGLLNIIGDTYMFLCINDLHTVEQKTYGDYIQCLAKIIIREDKFTVIYDDGSSFLSNEIIFPSPTDLKYLNVQLLNPYGEIVDLNCMDFSFSIEITEVLNTQLYDFYRNYIWLGTVPTVKRPNGSAMTLLNGPR